jgi:hypothetical protein
VDESDGSISSSIVLKGSLSKMFVRQGYAEDRLFLTPRSESGDNPRYSPPASERTMDITFEPWYLGILGVSSKEIHCLHLGDRGSPIGVIF